LAVVNTMFSDGSTTEPHPDLENPDCVSTSQLDGQCGWIRRGLGTKSQCFEQVARP